MLNLIEFKSFDNKYYGIRLSLHLNLYPSDLELCLKLQSHLEEDHEAIFLDYKDVCELSAEFIKIKKEMEKHLKLKGKL